MFCCIEAPNFLMADLPYAIIVTGDGELMEHKLANHNGKTKLLWRTIPILCVKCMNIV